MSLNGASTNVLSLIVEFLLTDAAIRAAFGHKEITLGDAFDDIRILEGAPMESSDINQISTSAPAQPTSDVPRIPRLHVVERQHFPLDTYIQEIKEYIIAFEVFDHDSVSAGQKADYLERVFDVGYPNGVQYSNSTASIISTNVLTRGRQTYNNDIDRWKDVVVVKMLCNPYQGCP